MRLPTLLVAAALLAACSREHERLVHIMTKTAYGVKVGGRVQYDTSDVGVVRAIYQTPNGVRVDVAILDTAVHVRNQDVARILTVGTFGEQVVRIEPGSPAAARLAPGASIPAVGGPDSAAKPAR